MNLELPKNNIIGKWLLIDNRLVPDGNCELISELLNNRFVKISNDVSGWLTLYKDPIEGELWELSYPNGGLQGGGAPKLTRISTNEAEENYGSFK